MSNFNLNQIDINNTKFYSFLLSLFSIEDLKDKLTSYYNNSNNKQIFQLLYDFYLNKNINGKIKEYFLDSIKSNNFKLIIDDIFYKIDSGISNEYKKDFENNQLYIYDEEKSKEKFLNKNKNPSIIKKLFFLSMETITLCKECNLNVYNFNYAKFFLIDLDKEKNKISLSDKIFKSEEIISKEKCSFCNGQLRDCIKKEKIFDFPEILIVILDGKTFNNFKLENNIEILCNNNRNALYYLISFIESGTNTVYIQEKYNWYKYIENNKKNCGDYLEKNPIVLFYKLTVRKYINQIINGEKIDNIKNTDLNIKNDFKPQNNVQKNINNNKMLNNNLNMGTNLYKNNFNNVNKINNFNNNINNSANNFNNFMTFNQNNMNNNINLNANNQNNFLNHNNNCFNIKNENNIMNNRYTINNNLNETQKILEQSNNKIISINKVLENKNKDLMKENNDLKKEIGDLKDKLNIEKSEKEKLNLKIKELENLLKKEKESKSLIENENKNKNENNNGKLLELYEELRLKDKDIREKNQEIKKLNERISRFPFELSENEQLMSVIFISTDQKIHYSIICKNTDQFTKVETQLYKEYSNYKDIENVFVVNGRKINKYKSLKDNNIKNNDIIQLNPIE